MADISKELQAWKNARLGKDVRQAQIDLSTKINVEVEQNTTKVSQGIQNINTAVTRAETAAGNADVKAAAANSAAAAANAAAARAEGYVLGDITDKTVTYTEPATAGENAPASGAKISAVLGWVVKRVKELGESIAGVKSNHPQKMFAGRVLVPRGSNNVKIDVQFGISFASLPGVVATPLYVGSTTAVQVAVSEANYTNCKLVCTNNSTTTDYYVSYIAYERMDV